MQKEIEISEIKLKIKDSIISLSIVEAKELRNILNTSFPDKMAKEYVYPFILPPQPSYVTDRDVRNPLHWNPLNNEYKEINNE